MLFSKRTGKSLAYKSSQIEGMDSELQNGLWNVYRHFFFEEVLDDEVDRRREPNRSVCYELWHNFFKSRFDEAPYSAFEVIKNIKEYFFSESWYKIYDLIEFTLTLNGKNDYIYFDTDLYCNEINLVLEKEFSGYRIINDIVSPISNIQESSEIECAFDNTTSFTPFRACNIHLQQSLKMLSDRVSPDYRNSIKESISAVESLVKIISGNEKGSLSDAIDKIKTEIRIHGALEKSIKSLYGYASDSSGIRHALIDEPDCEFEDAQFMIVSCSSFINYIIIKAKKAGII